MAMVSGWLAFGETEARKTSEEAISKAQLRKLIVRKAGPNSALPHGKMGRNLG